MAIFCLKSIGLLDQLVKTGKAKLNEVSKTNVTFIQVIKLFTQFILCGVVIDSVASQIYFTNLLRTRFTRRGWIVRGGFTKAILAYIHNLHFSHKVQKPLVSLKLCKIMYVAKVHEYIVNNSLAFLCIVQHIPTLYIHTILIKWVSHHNTNRW